MKKSIKKSFYTSLVFTLILLFGILNSNTILASVDTNIVNPPKSQGEFTPRTITEGDYKEATNSFDDNVVGYYLVTHDPSKVGLKSINYKATNYPLAGVLYQENESFDFNAVTASDGAKILAYNGPSNITVFFDDGKYNDSDPINYTAFSRENNSYIGLNKDGNGESTAIISKSARSETTTTTPSIDKLIERNIIAHKNIYFENLKFDGQNRDMVPASFKQNGKNIKNRGEYFFNITGGDIEGFNNTKATDGLVMRDLVIENVGKSNSAYNTKNVAINVHYNPGQINLENITIRNTKTTSNYGIIQVQDGDATYLKDINIDMSEAGPKASPIKVETTNKFFNFSKQMAVIKSLKTTNIKDPKYDHIYVQDYRYDYVKAPDDYRYAVWNTIKGGYFSSSFEIYKTIQNPEKGKAIQDLRDNYWIVDTSSEISIEDQLIDIGRVINYTQEDVANPKSPRAQIKFIGDTIPSFNIPNKYNFYFYSTKLWKNPDASNMPIDIVAVENVDVDIKSSSAMIATIADFKADFKNEGDTNLYNFDFKTSSNYTADEVISGIDKLTAIDDHDGSYPSPMNIADYYGLKDPAIKKLANVSYNNCKFVGLVSNLNASLKNEIKVDESVKINTAIKDEETYTSPNITSIENQYADDKDLYYESSDTSIAVVDENGNVTGLKEGKVTIYVKAKDRLNQGEIEKAFAKFEIKIVKKDVDTFIASHTFISSDGSELSKEVKDLLPPDILNLKNGDTVNPTQPLNVEVIVNGGKWVFKGYNPTSATINNSNINFEGTWEFIPNSQPPIEEDDDYPMTGGLILYPSSSQNNQTIKIHKAYIKGYPDGSVRPEGNITRAEASAMVARLEELNMTNESKPNYIDVESGWYNKYLNAALEKDMLLAEDGKLRPNEAITRAEFARLIAPIDKNGKIQSSPFDDVKGHKFEDAISKAYTNGRIDGYPDGSFRPDGAITRTEAAKILNSLYDRKVEERGLKAVSNIEALKHFTDLSKNYWGYYELVEATNTHSYERYENGKVEERWIMILSDYVE